MFTLQSDLDRLFTTLFDTPTGSVRSGSRPWAPAFDLVEAKDHYVLRADLPGLTMEDVTLELHDRVLTIAGERQAAEAGDGARFVRVERGAGAFRRTLTLPEGVDVDAVRATLELGVLTVRVPKPEARRPRRISITPGGGEPAAIEGEARAA